MSVRPGPLERAGPACVHMVEFSAASTGEEVSVEQPGVQPGSVLSPSSHPAVPLTSTHSQCDQGVGNGGLSMQRSARSDLRCPVFW